MTQSAPPVPVRFRTIADDGRPLRVVLVGLGSMGRAWLAAIAACPEVQLAGVVDLDLAAARERAAGLAGNVAFGTDAVEVAARCGGQAVIDVTVPSAHHQVTMAALFAGLPVLGEKPVASTVAQGLSLAAAADINGELFMVSQSRRYNAQLWEFRARLRDIGRPGVLTTEFFKAPHFGGFRDEMDHPLLLDMAIHQLDAARFLLDDDPVTVYCEEYNPSWSWYRGDAGCTAVFRMSSGARYVFTGTWCSPGLETSWNGSWRASAERGTALWSGDDPPQTEVVAGRPAADAVVGSDGGPVGAPLLGEAIQGSLREFVRSLRTGIVPMGEVHDNIASLAMVEAAIESSRSGRRVVLSELMQLALEQAVRSEAHSEVAAVLESWQADGRFGGPAASVVTSRLAAPVTAH